MAYEIEKGVPILQVAGGAKKYPWDNMEVGDSFFVPGRTIKNFGMHGNVASKRAGRKFTARSVDGGIRVWRVK